MSDASEEPTLEEAMDFILRSHAGSMRTMLPAKVESYDATTQTCDVKPLLQLAYDTGEGILKEEIPVISKVPVIFPRAGDYFMSFPLKAGHYVMLVFCDRSYDVWWRGSGTAVVDPIDMRQHSIADPVAMVGFYPDQDALADVHVDNIVIGKDSGAQIHIKADEVSLYEENADDFVALATETKSNDDALKTRLDNLKAALNTWVPAPNDGGAALKTALAAWLTAGVSVSEVAATKVKAT